ncbi:MAG TPA: Gfo/Idh/MocA family oxidoreductase [Candidatus Hydrogenedentes bacterium]|jgi:predicted dehydrogenase|nr:Gfo/Idh/MocA family oxidoreductase [Candidatus Hydrogenedentota bacterium]
MKRPQESGRRRSTTRRDFLKRSAVAASATHIARYAHAAGSDVIRVGMIGCGGRNTGAAAQALTADPGARLVAMCDIFMERVKSRRQRLRDQMKAQVAVDDDHCFAGFDSYKQVIEASDVVLIANAAKFHPLHAMAALQAGRHVFVEKPHGIDPAGIKLMQRAADTAKEKGVSLVSGLQSRYHTGYAETVQRIHGGAIGDVVCIEENFLRAPYVVIDRAPELSELEWQCSTQYHFRWLSGDDVPQSLVHNLDRASWVLHNAVPARCHGLGGRSSMTAPIFGDVFDHHAIVYEFENGVKIYAFCRTTEGCYGESSSIVYGTKGKASIMNAQIWGENPWRWEGACDPYQIEHDRLFKAIRTGEPLNNGGYMARSTLIGVMGQLSCYTGEEITWEQASASDFYYPPAPEDCHDGMEPPVMPGADGSYPVPRPGFTRMLDT